MLQKCAALVFVLVAGAQELDGIRSLIVEMNKARQNNDRRSSVQLFAPDGTLRIGNRIIATGHDAIDKALQRSRIWSEVTAPVIGKESVRMVAPGVALVDASETRYGSLILKQTAPVALRPRLDGGDWGIVSLWQGDRSPPDTPDLVR